MTNLFRLIWRYMRMCKTMLVVAALDMAFAATGAFVGCALYHYFIKI